MRAATAFFIYILVLFGSMVYHYRYDWGLAAPKFRPGDCIETTSSNEFATDVTRKMILKVGKTEYLSAFVREDGTYNPRYTHVNSAKYIDRDYKLGCTF